jgi:peroxiredoxin
LVRFINRFFLESPLFLQVGDIAPDFSLAAAMGTERNTFKLSDYRGKKNVVLAFYALDWSPT